MSYRITLQTNDPRFQGYARLLLSMDGSTFFSTGQRLTPKGGVFSFTSRSDVHVRLVVTRAAPSVKYDPVTFPAGVTATKALGDALPPPPAPAGALSGSLNVYVANANKTWPSGMVVGTQRKPTLLFANLESDPDAATYPAPPISGPFTFYYGPSLDGGAPVEPGPEPEPEPEPEPTGPQRDANGIITSDDFSGSAANLTDFLARDSVPNAGGFALKPLSGTGTVVIGNGGVRLTSSSTLDYPLEAAKARIKIDVVTYTSTATPRIRFHSGDPLVQVSVFARGNGEIATDWNGQVITTAPAGTFTAGDTLDVTLDNAAGAMSINHLRAGSLLSTYTRTGVGIPPTFQLATLAQGGVSQNALLDNLIVGEVQ